MPFQKGQSGNPKGRAPGTVPKVTQEVRALCRTLIANGQYRRTFRKRLFAGELAPPLEALVWHYAYGKPKETVDLTGTLSIPDVVTFLIRKQPDADCRD